MSEQALQDYKVFDILIPYITSIDMESRSIKFDLPHSIQINVKEIEKHFESGEANQVYNGTAGYGHEFAIYQSFTGVLKEQSLCNYLAQKIA